MTYGVCTRYSRSFSKRFCNNVSTSNLSTELSGREFSLFFDGGSRGNPGISGAGAVLYDSNKKECWHDAKYLGICTNNVAEVSVSTCLLLVIPSLPVSRYPFVSAMSPTSCPSCFSSTCCSSFVLTTAYPDTKYSALILGLRYLVSLPDVKEISRLTVHGDSKLVIEQIKGAYKVKSETLKPLFLEVKTLLEQIPHVVLLHIPRELNSRADELSNIAMDSRGRHSTG